MDNDRSTGEDRATDRYKLREALENGIAGLLYSGIEPTATRIWEFANSARIKSASGIRTDRDDKIGVSRSFGKSFVLEFTTGAHYRLRGTLSIFR